MTKKVIIKKIKDIIKDYGGFSTGEVQAETSPCVSSMGKMVALAERFKTNTVEVDVYKPSGFSSDPIDDYELTYEELSKSTLEEILVLAEQYKEQNEE